MGSRDWSNLQVSAATRRFIDEAGFKRMTPVQAIAVPLLLKNRDVAVEACTGSGKTLAFLIPVVEMLLRCDAFAAAPFNIGSVILSPTRELTGQIHEVLDKYLAAVRCEDAAAGERLKSQLFVGGTEAKAAVDALCKLDERGKLQIVVATPGRLSAMMRIAGREKMSFKSLEALILDEADRLLQLGFASDIDEVLSVVPKQRRTGLFSATLTSELQRLMKTGMRNPVHVCVRRKQAEGGSGAAGGNGTEAGADGSAAAADKGRSASSKAPATQQHELPTKLQNYFATVPAQQKLSFLVRFLRLPEVCRGKTIVFFLSCACVDFVHAVLRELIDKQGAGQRKGGKRNKNKVAPKSFRIEKLHGQMDQVARKKAYDKFCKSPLEDGGVLLATDLAARGIDVEAVAWTVQFDAPVDPSAFVHRIGRAARAGMSGKSLVMVMPSESSYVPFLQQRGISIDELPSMKGLSGQGEADAKNPSDSKEDLVLRRTRKIMETDRAVMLKGTKAFVSFVRAYQEHQLPYLFPVKGLDMGGLASGFCLLRMPRMKEILGREVKGFVQSSVKPADVPFKNKVQEKQRQEALKQKKEAGEQEEAERAEKRKAELKAKAKAKPEKQRTRTQKRQAKRNDRADEWNMLAAEERLAKKLRTGKITTAQFQKGVRKATDPGGAAHNSDSDDEDLSEESDVVKTEDSRWLVHRRKKKRGCKSKKR